MPLARIVARQLGAELEVAHARRQSETAATLNERVRMADSTRSAVRLESLTYVKTRVVGSFLPSSCHGLAHRGSSIRISTFGATSSRIVPSSNPRPCPSA